MAISNVSSMNYNLLESSKIYHYVVILTVEIYYCALNYNRRKYDKNIYLNAFWVLLE